LFQSLALFPQMTVRQNIGSGVRTTKKADRERMIDEKIKSFYLTGLDHKYPSQLSGGQQQRVALARMLASEPEALLLDEPFSALDAKIRSQMREELKKIQSELGITIVFVTHDQEEAMALSHRIIVMNKGKFEQVGTPKEIYDNPASRYVASFIGEMNFLSRDGKTTAIRPEDVILSTDGTGDIKGYIRTIMVLGHFTEVNVQCGEDVIKCYVNREIADPLNVGDSVSLRFAKTHIYSDN
jgi:putative spermidine/putrescine transport system ATP-binding protein